MNLLHTHTHIPGVEIKKIKKNQKKEQELNLFYSIFDKHDFSN